MIVSEVPFMYGIVAVVTVEVLEFSLFSGACVAFYEVCVFVVFLNLKTLFN